MLPSRSMAMPVQTVLALPSPLIGLGLYTFLILVIVAGMLLLLGGTLDYTMDDPYIHLALAERIAIGHYGINLGEVTAPSSSVLWPFLLLPGVGTEWHIWVPLGINLLCGAATALMIGLVVDRLPWTDGTRLLRAGCVLVLILLGNLAGLPFTGMEHSPQVLVAAVCAFAVVEALVGRPVPFWCLVVVALGPAIRYELLAMAGALGIVLAGQRRWGAAVGLLAASLLLPLVFGAWLVSQGLPPLPNSVLAKSGAYAESSGLFASVLAIVEEAVRLLVLRPQFWPLPAMAAIVAVLALRAPPARRWPLLGALAALLLHVLVGRFGVFRYESYALLFGGLVMLAALAWAPRPLRLAGAVLLVAAAAYQGRAVVLAPRAAHNIHEQQYQMHRFVAKFWKQDVAVNDLGWVSYRVNPQVYVLDLYGLASNEALQRKVKDASWMADMVRRRGIRLAIIYPWWFDGIPEHWLPIARLHLSGRRVAPADDKVTFYATDPNAAEELRERLSRFEPTLPLGVRLTYP